MMGLLVGGLTSPTSADFNRTLDCRVYGSVSFREDGNLRADRGAVVLILPANKKTKFSFRGKLGASRFISGAG